MAQVIIDYLDIHRGQKILDIGCAKGYLVKALRWLGRDAYGFDISDYALEKSDHILLMSSFSLIISITKSSLTVSVQH